MKATSVFSLIFSIVMILAIAFGVHNGNAGHESFPAYLCGFVAVLSIVTMFARGGIKSIDVPAPGFRRFLSVLFRMFDVVLFLALAYQGHFVVATLVGIVLVLQLGALGTVMNIEAELKATLKKRYAESVTPAGQSSVASAPAMTDVTGELSKTFDDTAKQGAAQVNPVELPGITPQPA
ncbi:hypothetical protein [Burkholderia vietnamiensis]|uniref:hypothetical protein n=1 Tax=Burkholderia vietnamiensis TaxID=60552 RepID=UPI001CACC8FF|nr:hypothetical protein [Burkholderia vietnamiensis]CAG9229151.1 membrane hypothetical protein [Burkholderia vietnamiensis]HDR9086310.1 hypothetical protein [Burkholderia vietnamiensis]